MPGETRRQDLTDGRSEVRAPEYADKRVAVDGVVQRLARPLVVERWQVNVERRIPDRRQRGQVDLIGVLGADLSKAVSRRLIEHPVGVTVLDRSNGGFLRLTENVGDLIGESIRLGVDTPFFEVGIAHDLDALARIVALDRVGAGAGDDFYAHVLSRRQLWQDRCVWHGQLVHELRVGLREVESDRVSRFISHYATLERAALGCLDTGVRADNPVIECAGRRTANLEDAPEGGDHVLDRYRVAVREFDSLAQLENVGLVIVLRGRHLLSEVGHHRKALYALALLESNQAVVDCLVKLPVL